MELNLPEYDVKIDNRDGKMFIFDGLRRRYVSLTPEEWVRQHFVNYLTAHLGYPKAYMANEVELRVGEKRLRCDSVLYSPSMRPRMIMEYKAPTVPLRAAVFGQISAYNTLLKADYLVVSNGLAHFCVKADWEKGGYIPLAGIPLYKDL